MRDILTRAWSQPFSTKSNFAREHATLIAFAACSGLITTRLSHRTYGTRWLITPAGIARIFRKRSR